MVYIEYELVAEDKGRVMFRMYKPELLPEERKQSGLLVESLPEPEDGKGIASLFVNPATIELWYEYQPVPEAPLYPQTQVGQMQKEIDDLKLLIAELLAGGAA